MSSGPVLPSTLRDKVIKLVADIGEGGARQRLEISRSTLERAMAGLPQRRGSIALIRLNLEASKQAEE